MRRAAVWGAVVVAAWAVCWAGQAARQTGYFAVKTGSRTFDLAAVVPPDLTEDQECQLWVLFAEPNPGNPHYLEDLLAEQKLLPALASEMEAVFLFVIPKEGGTASQVAVSARTAQMAFMRNYPIDPARVVVIAHGGGAGAALRFFDRNPKGSSSLVLVSPIAAFLEYADAANTLHNIEALQGSAPAFGSSRISRLKLLIKAKELAEGKEMSFGDEMMLQNSTAPSMEANSELAQTLKAKGEALKPLATKVKDRVEKALETARKQAESRLALLQKSKTTGKRRGQMFETYVEENFPWPDLTAAAEAAAAAEVATAAGSGSSKKQNVTEGALLAVMQRYCTRCHKNCSSVSKMRQKNWILPGSPEKSKLYTIIGTNKKKGGTYHNLSDQDKQKVYDFIKGLN